MQLMLTVTVTKLKTLSDEASNQKMLLFISDNIGVEKKTK